MAVVNRENHHRSTHFDSLLEWLDMDRERASQKYEGIRQSLIQIFTWRRCADAELLADETLNRVMSRLPEIRKTYEGNASAYIHAVAKRVLLEHMRAQSADTATSLPENQTPNANETESMDDCLERCFSVLTDSNRSLIQNYYRQEPAKKQSFFKDLSEKLGISQKTLRVRMYRIRSTLEACVRACMEQESTISEPV